MKICAKLLNEINFEPNALTPCCDIRGIDIPKFPYTGGPIDLNLYARHIENTLQAIQNNESVCKGCPKLFECESDKLVNNCQFRNISVNMHRYFCNCKCTYCDFWKMPERGFGYDIFPGLESLHKANALRENFFISWGGGEPSILPTFDKSSEFALNIGAYQQIHTNCLRFSPAILKVLAQDRGVINVSLDSGTRETYREIKGVDGFDKVIQNLKQYRDAGAKNIILKYIVFEQNNNVKEINAFLHIAKLLRVNEIEFSLNFQEVNAGKVSEKTLLAAAYLISQGEKTGIQRVAPFYVDDIWINKINEKKRNLA